MTTDALTLAQTRYTAKAYDSARKIPAAQFEKLMEIVRLTPSSTNVQAWHFLIADNEAAKARIAKSMAGSDDYNIPKVMDSSHTSVLCTLNEVSEAHLERVTDAEIAAGRYGEHEREFASPRAHYVAQYRATGLIPLWTECQTHIALGQLLWAAALEGIDSTAIGGFRSDALDAEFGLAEKGMHSTVIVTLGYHSNADTNAAKPKGRLNTEQLFTRL